MKAAKAKTKARKRPATSARRRVRFEIAASEGAEVYLAGSFNNWDPKKNRLWFQDGVYSATVLVPRGRHEYKFIVDDVWCIDPECSEWTPNGLGSLNSVLVVE